MLARIIRQQKDDMIVYISQPRKLYQRTSPANKNFSQVAECKINLNKWVAFLYSNDKQAEKEIRETTPFIMATHNIKYLGVTIAKQGKAYMTISSSLSRKKSRKILENGDIFHAHGLTKLI